MTRILLPLLLATAGPAIAQTDAHPLIDAPAGPVSGTRDGAVRVFKGIPYAQPPVGPLRWRAPVAMPRWSRTRPATDFGLACPQAQGGTSIYAELPMPTGEDCLTLNVWAPKDARHAPVMVWIHGGALVGGSSREPMYDGRRLAERGIVVVSINYRLGVLGWLAHRWLGAENDRGLSGNYGLLDQIAALRWVRANVAAFGGDPAKVTLAGESAGGLSVLYLLTAPSARGLFARAIAESSYMISMAALKRTAFGAPSAESAGEKLTSALGTGDLAALRALDPQVLVERSAKLGFAPFGVVDGAVLPRQVIESFDAGEQAKVPVLAGYNSGEIRSLRMLAPPPPADAAAYERGIRERYGDLADAFLKHYPADRFAESILATTRDALYGWTAQRLVRSQAKAGEPAYLYVFDHGYPAADAAGLHGFHASELPYVFGTAARTPPRWPAIPATEGERSLSAAMTDYWASFVRDGRPVAPGAAAWPAWTPNAGYMLFADAPTPRTDPDPGMFALNERIVCRRRAAGSIGWNWNVGSYSPPLPPRAAGCD